MRIPPLSMKKRSRVKRKSPRATINLMKKVKVVRPNLRKRRRKKKKKKRSPINLRRAAAVAKRISIRLKLSILRSE